MFEVVKLVDSTNLVQQWLNFAAVSDKTASTYANCLRQMRRYFVDNGVNNPTRADLELWRESLIASGKSASTIQLYVTACRLFFRFLAQEKLYPNIADNLKSRVRLTQNHKRDALSIEQSKQLVKVVTGRKLLALRDRAIIALMLTSGVRSIEVVRANVADIRYFNGRAYLRQGQMRQKRKCVNSCRRVEKYSNVLEGSW